ncbi:hypothetical protein [Sedimentitalea arenosa]|uniref:Uncharacterized protein n=1 Tax=Sedimentitalea arenosa TaxID=2798803 RepID=A0A8J7J918_9RHOB|nr:hypothetical protein [Arenibacterium arenosum]MBJ6373565.1 hypothetical protein [Arenibacterium arenosum]
MAALDAESRRALLLPQAVADAFVGIVLAETRAAERADRLQALEALADAAANGTEAAVDRLRREGAAEDPKQGNTLETGPPSQAT